MRRHVIDYLKSIYNLVANNKNPQMEHIDVKNLRTSDFFLPELVQLVFNKYKKTEDNTLSTGERAQLFAELTALLGEDLLERTLRLLDEWSFITYYTPDRCRKIVELVSKRNTAHVFRILPGINYCKCPYFQDFVLQLRVNTESGSEYVSFTCEHVLAQRLHQLFNSPSRKQILTLEQFKYFHEDIYVD